jgi:hypothetical protein
MTIVTMAISSVAAVVIGTFRSFKEMIEEKDAWARNL